MSYFDADNASKEKEGEELWDITCGKWNVTWAEDAVRHLPEFDDE